MIRLYQTVEMRRHEALGQQAGFRGQDSQCQTVEPHNEVRRAPVHDFVMGRKTKMDGLSHSSIVDNI